MFGPKCYLVLAMKVFTTWKSAHTYAIELARQCKMSAGIEKSREFNKEIFLVKLLPRPENRCGHELRMEVVEPTDTF
jgi:hypothetical protein